jgi:chemotaxis protein CheX
VRARKAAAPSGKLVLAPVLDLRAATPLAEQLLKHRGQPLTLDGSKVERLGALCLQVLLSAIQTWTQDGMALQLSACSASLIEDLRVLGVDPEQLKVGA